MQNCELFSAILGVLPIKIGIVKKYKLDHMQKNI